MKEKRAWTFKIYSTQIGVVQSPHEWDSKIAATQDAQRLESIFEDAEAGNVQFVVYEAGLGHTGPSLPRRSASLPNDAAFIEPRG